MGFATRPPSQESNIFNPTYYSLSSDVLSLDLADSLYLNKSDYRLSYLSNVVLGQASPMSVLTLDSNLDITGINLLSCTALSVNGSVVVAPPAYVLSITPGTAAASKALVLDASRNITNINSLSATTLAGTISTASQPNITSIGSLGSLTVSARSADFLSLVNTSGTTSTSMSFNSGTYYSSLGLRSNSDVLGESNNFCLRHNGIDSISVGPGGSVGFGGYSPSATYAVRMGSLSCDSIAIGTTTYDLSTLGSTAGTAAASKALILDSSRSVTNINSLSATSISGTLQTAAQPNITSIQSLKMASGQLMFNTTTPYTSPTFGSPPVSLVGGNIYIKSSNAFNDGGGWDMPMFLESSNASPIQFAFQFSPATSATSTNACAIGTVSNNDLRFMSNNGTKMTISASGRVGVGTLTPSAMMQISGSVCSNVALSSPYANATSTSYSTSSGTLTDSVALRVDNAISVGVRGVYISSDRRIKRNIKPIQTDRAMAFVSEIDPKEYQLVDEQNKAQLGYIAQDIFAFDNGVCGLISNEEMHNDNENGFTPEGIQLTVSYERLTPLLHVALRDALHQIDELRQRLSSLEPA